MARAAGLRRVHVLAWRDLADVEAGGSEVHAAEVLRRWADAGIDVTLRTSYAQGHPPGGPARRLPRRAQARSVHGLPDLGASPRCSAAPGPSDGLVEYWNGTPYLSPLWARGPHVTVVHHVHKDMWRLVLDEKLAPWGEFIERRVAPPIYRRTRPRDPVRVLAARADRLPPLLAAAHHRRAAGHRRPLHARPAPKSPTPLIVSVGRLMAPKRFDELIRVAAEVRERHPSLQLVIVGDGYERLALEEQISDLDALDWIRLAGHVSDEELITLYRQAWLVTSASIAEGWGMTLTEAAACGTPAVATRINGHLDAVRRRPQRAAGRRLA